MKLTRRHPASTNLSKALKEEEGRRKKGAGIEKQATIMQTKAADGEDSLGASMTPTSEQLSRINSFTRRPVTADEVVAFPTLSCNDLPDRDDDRFKTDCVNDFAALEGDLSSVGKSYMLSHDYTKLPVGRIFGVGTKKVGGSQFLTNEVYIPKTAANQSLIEGIDFGVNWAVSVGVMLGKEECSVCKAPFSFWGWWCVTGHDKGSYYQTDAETDEWGYPIPCEPNEKGAIKCIREFSEPRDFYELSQVFLGAQYFASLEKEPGFKGILKAASASSLPIIGLSAEEARKLPLRHEPEEVSKARTQFSVSTLEDGSLSWVDNEKLVWVFDPENPDAGVSSLGKASDQEDDQDGEVQLDGDDEGNLDSAAGDEPGDGSEGSGIEGSASDHPAEGSEQPSGGDEGSVVTESAAGAANTTRAAPGAGEESVSKKQVVEAARRAGFSPDVVQRIEDAEGNGLEEAFRFAAGVMSKAAVGDEYVKSLKADAVNWYVKARQDGNANTPVNVESYQKRLDRFGDDLELLRGEVEDQKSLVQAKFPSAARRSSVGGDPHKEPAPSDAEGMFDSDNDKRAARWHG